MVIAGSVDLSTSAYFPPIKNGTVDSINSVAFSTAYYQYTYEVNRVKNISSNNNSVVYSPAWLDSYIKNLDQAYIRLRDKGCLKWSEMPYVQGKRQLSNNENAMITALNTRLEDYYLVSIDTSKECISSNSDVKLEVIKALLRDGKILVAQMGSKIDLSNIQIGTTKTGEKIIYRNGAADVSNDIYAVTIVGYNDDISIDVNGDGRIEKSEKGALKVAFAKGSSWGNSGYMWVSYDSLNQSSQITGAWERNCSGTRRAIFSNGAQKQTNNFYYISIKDKAVSLISKLYFTKNANDITQVGYCRNGKLTYTNVDSKGSYMEVNDVSLSDPDKEDFIDCHVKNGKNNDTLSGVRGILMDDGKRIISTVNPAIRTVDMIYVNYNSNFRVNFVLGDVTYDGKVTLEDAQKVQKMALKTIIGTNFDNVMADYNKDGRVTMEDSQLILKKALKI